MNSSKPFVSVIIPAVGKRRIHKAIESVLNSSYPFFELIVVNDGGKINFEPNGFKLIEQKHKGLASARNTGIKNSKGKIIAFIDDDAKAEKNWIEEMVSGFVSDEIGAVSGKSIEYFAGKTEENILWACNNYGLIKVNPTELKKNDFTVVHGCNMAFSKKALDAVNGFDENFSFYFDEIDLSLRLNRAGYKINVNPDAIVHHFIKSNLRFGNLFEFGKFKYYFVLKNYGFFSFPLLVLKDLPLMFYDIKIFFVHFLNKKIFFRKFVHESFLIFLGRISGTRKAFIDFMR